MLSVPDASFSPPASAGGDSYISTISADGRYVLFTSAANNLAHRTNGEPYILPAPLKMNAFLRDRVLGTTTLISVDSTNTKAGDDDSILTGISTNGQYVLFETASRLINARTSTNRLLTSEVYLRDVINQTTTLVSVRMTTNSKFNGSSEESVMTPDARYVAFESADNNFVAGDTNNASDVFVRDLVSGTTQMASAGFSNRISSSQAEITPDGKFVAFLGTLVSSNPTQDVYVRDLVASNTFDISTNSHQYISGVPSCYAQEISQDGKYVAYQANANLGATTAFIFRHNLLTGTDDIVTSNAIPTSATQPFDMSPDGRFIAFVGNSSSTGTAVYLSDAQTGTTNLVSTYVPSPPVTPPGPVTLLCESPAVDATGRFVAFRAIGPVTTNADSSTPHIYRRDMQSPYPELVDVGTNGSAANRNLNSDYSMSSDGRFIAFDSPDADLVAQDGNKSSDVFVRDLTAETTELISSADPSLMTHTGGIADKRSGARVSADGHFAVFIAGGWDLVPGHTNRYRQVFLRDLVNQSNSIVSVDTNGLGNADGSATGCAISADGRYVVFASLADNLVPNDTNHVSDVFLRDLQTGTTILVSSNGTSGGSANGASTSPTISADGRFVTYFSTATNIVPISPTPPVPANLYEWDRTTGSNYVFTTNGTYASAVTPDGHYVAFNDPSLNLYVWDSQLKQRIFTNINVGTLSAVAISTNGQWLAYLNRALGYSNLYLFDRLTLSNSMVIRGNFNVRPNPRFSGDARYLVYSTATNGSTVDVEVFVFDSLTGSNTLVSRNFSSGKMSFGKSDLPDISADGRYITYQSTSSEIAPSDNNGHLRDVFLYDQLTGSTVLLSASIYQSGTAEYESQCPAFTADGETVSFQSWAWDLVGDDFNQSSDIFLFKILDSSDSTNPPPVLTGQILFVPVSSYGSPPTLPQLTWAAAPGLGYQVQYKTNLTDPAWLPVNGSVIIQNGQGYVQDLSPDPTQRFYRIVGY